MLQKPISSVAPTSVQHSSKLSNVYQTSSIKVQPVEPQTISTSNKQLVVTSSSQNQWVQSPQQLVLSPPQSTSTPTTGTPETSVDKLPKPALPPKPAIKTPPRQSQIINDADFQPPPLPLTEPPDDTNKPQGQQKSLHQTNQNRVAHLTGAFNQVHVSNHKGQTAPSAEQTTQLGNTLQISSENMPIIKAKPLTLKKQQFNEQPKLRSLNSYNKLNGINQNNRKIEIPPAFNFSESSDDKSSEIVNEKETKGTDETDKIVVEEFDTNDQLTKEESKPMNESVVRRCKKGNLKQTGKANLSRRVSFDPLALLLDASLEGELELVKKTATQVSNPSAANDEGITALHNAICAGHLEIVKFLVEFGCDVNAQDSDGWTPLHCAASCNNVAMVRFLVEHGACIFATTLSDHETAAEKCEEDEEGFDGCSEYLYSKYI